MVSYQMISLFWERSLTFVCLSNNKSQEWTLKNIPWGDGLFFKIQNYCINKLLKTVDEQRLSCDFIKLLFNVYNAFNVSIKDQPWVLKLFPENTLKWQFIRLKIGSLKSPERICWVGIKNSRKCRKKFGIKSTRQFCTVEVHFFKYTTFVYTQVFVSSA